MGHSIISEKDCAIGGGVRVPAGSCKDDLPWAYTVQKLTYFCTAVIKLGQKQGEKSFWDPGCAHRISQHSEGPPSTSVSNIQVYLDGKGLTVA